MSAYIHGSAPGVAVGAAGEADGDGRTLFHRYELVGGVLVRRRIAERHPRLERDVRLVDVLVDEDAAGRRVRVVRGIALSERDLAGPGRTAAWREFDVGADLVRAIADDLGASLQRRPTLRLAAVDGVRVG